MPTEWAKRPVVVDAQWPPFNGLWRLKNFFGENKKENASGKMLAIDFCVKSAATERCTMDLKLVDQKSMQFDGFPWPNFLGTGPKVQSRPIHWHLNWFHQLKTQRNITVNLHQSSSTDPKHLGITVPDRAGYVARNVFNDVEMLRMLGTLGMPNFGAPKCLCRWNLWRCLELLFRSHLVCFAQWWFK